MRKSIQKHVALCLLGTGIMLNLLPAAAAVAMPVKPAITAADLAKLPDPSTVGIQVSPDDAMPRLMAHSAVLIEAKTGKVLYEREKSQRRYPASTTKIMTLIVALEHSKPNDIVTVSSQAVGAEGSSLDLMAGDKIPMNELLTAMMMRSGNDATIAVAEHVAGSMKEFARMMTEKAHEIGATDTNFVNSHGLPDDDHYTTAQDLAIITAYGFSVPGFEDIMSKDKAVYSWYNNPSKEIISENKLLWQYEGGNGGKTGYTSKAGRCVVSTAKRDGIQLIAVVLDSDFMWTDAYSLLDYGFEKLEPLTILKKGEAAGTIAVDGSRQSDLKLLASRESVVGYTAGERPKIEKKLDLPQSVTAPVKKGAVVGRMLCYADGKLVDRVDLVAAENVNGNHPTFWMTIKSWMQRLTKGFF